MLEKRRAYRRKGNPRVNEPRPGTSPFGNAKIEMYM